MKKSTFGYLVGIAVFFLSVMPVFAQSSDTAELTLTGQVPSLVRIGFGSLVTDAESHDFGDLTEPTSFSSSIRYLANVQFTINAASTNAGVLMLDGSADGFASTVPYTLSWAGAPLDLSSGTATAVSGNARGIGSFAIEVSVTPVSLDGFDDSTTVDEVPAQGDYTDTLTFTITADE